MLQDGQGATAPLNVAEKKRTRSKEMLGWAAKRLKRESTVLRWTPSKDVENMTRLMMGEAKASLPKAARVVGKVLALGAFGFLLASNCCFSMACVPIGVLALSIAAGWLDALGYECSLLRFFPDKTMNLLGAFLFRWQWVLFWTAIFYTASLMDVVSFLRFAPRERLSRVCTMAIAPLVLMLIGRAIEPFRFRRVRAQLQKAAQLARELEASRSSAHVSAVPSLVELEQVPLYKLGSVAKLLHDFVACFDVTDKLGIDLGEPKESQSKLPLQQVLSIIYSPFRVIASDVLLWESRDLVLYSVTGLYFCLVYVGSFYVPWAPLIPFCVLCPFLGPKSRAGRYLRALQEDIRQTQGRAVEKKGNMACDQEWDLGPVNVPMCIYIGGSHLAALYALLVLVCFGGVCPLFGNGQVVSAKTLVFAFVLYVAGGLGITAGVHRLWAHRSYKAGAPLRMLLMFFNSIANQGSIYHWARDHRVHHLYSDTTADPHDSNRGFWFSHIGWLLFKKHPAVYEAGKKINMSDLQADPIVMFQKRADPFWNLWWCFGFPAFMAMAWGDSLWNGFLVAGALRYTLLLNATWAVNSVVHAIGTRPYNAAHATTENGWVSLFALGEGWHNWHHAFAWDYAAAEMGPLSQFNPTKVFIDVMAFLGLAWDRKRALQAWAQRKARWSKTQGRPLSESIEGPPLFKSRIVTFGPEYEDEQWKAEGEEDECDEGSADKKCDESSEDKKCQ